ncbi:hypothetical protein GOARA_057_00170 [Gordonia araii NBRC 100433]|uniref:DUF4440 domain-containing protein n=1 Tax=Gordonia araii NBRC 100433 TaxID=1073574 RepID=G7H3R8_9ACTN|nr:SgcJ/EcaC family oxidoreductase [Gordonia araii]NNG98685.1 SgcJ/EcaC family oxidoreductase [Gordonia araii NBRC 100433]GAB10493.1 hypothetical protein GOARA_057_00170 [Gordonia araii NBRC 100433]
MEPQIPAGIGESLERMRAAWDAGDPGAYAAEFTDDATYVIFIGTLTVGREAIRDDHVPLFERWQKGSKMSLKVVDVKQLGPDVAIVVTEGGIGKGSRIKLDKVQTYVFVREPDRWRCAAFQNTKRKRLFAAINESEKKRLARKA